MIANQFEYKKATSVEEAINLLNEDTQILGGGHSLIPALKLRLNNPATLVDISKIDALKGIEDKGAHITIGAVTTHAAIAANELLNQEIPMMVQAASTIGDIQVRNVGTIGGSIAHADPAADWPAVLIAAQATIHLKSSNGNREVAVDDFFTGFYETALQEDEVITAISIPKNAANKNSAYAKFKQPASRFAIVGCAAAVEVEESVTKSASIGITGVAGFAYRATSVEQALISQPFNIGTIETAVINVTDSKDVMSDHYASEKYRTHLAHVYVKRVLKKIL